jgi:hypothetical protein
MTTKDHLLASKQAALAAKEAFKSQYGQALSDCAVGLGLNRDRDDWAMKVYARSAAAGSQLPHHFGPYEVDVEFTGQIAAF